MGIVKFSLWNFRRLYCYILNVIGVEDELWCPSLCTLTKEAAKLRETSVHFYQTTRRDVPLYNSLYTHGCDSRRR
jgi:hypothetical protein